MRPSAPEEIARRTSGLRNAAATPWRSRAASLSSMLDEVSAAMTSTRSTEAADATDDHAAAVSAAHRNSFLACIIGLPCFGAALRQVSSITPTAARRYSADMHARKWWYGSENHRAI